MAGHGLIGFFCIVCGFGVLIAVYHMIMERGAKARKSWAYDPARHCNVYNYDGCNDIDGILCNKDACPHYGFKQVA